MMDRLRCYGHDDEVRWSEFVRFMNTDFTTEDDVYGYQCRSSQCIPPMHAGYADFGDSKISLSKEHVSIARHFHLP